MPLPRWITRKKSTAVLDRAADLLEKDQAGLYKRVFSTDPSESTLLENWIRARIQMARKPFGVTSYQVLIASMARPAGGDSYRQLADPESVAFLPAEAEKAMATVADTFSTAQQRIGTEKVAVVFVNLGDAIAVALDEIEKGT